MLLDVNNLFSLDGNVALVTGGGTGMGRRMAFTLASAGGDATAVRLDISDVASIKAAFDLAEQTYGIVDVLVNSAAQIDFAPFPMIDDAAWNNLLAVNFSGTMRMCRECTTRLLGAKKLGSIINISSVTGLQALKNVPCCSSLKAAYQADCCRPA